MALLTRAQRRQQRDRYTEWIQVALLVLVAALAVYVVFTR